MGQLHMKKIILVLITLLLVIPSLVATQETDNHTQNNSTDLVNADFTHTVFAEYATTSWCHNCPTASDAIYELYQGQELPFYYVTLVADLNDNARERMRDFFNIVIPTVYFDGGNLLYIGNAGSVSMTKNAYKNMIEETGSRSIKNPISLTTNANWLGNAKIDIEVTVTNEGNGFYFGKLRTYVTEINSRWDDYDGNPYHYAMLDYAFDEILFLVPGSTKTFTDTWDGNENHNGLTFGDITQDNIMIMSATYHWIPHMRTGYEAPDYTQKYFAFYTDQADAVTLE